MNNLTTVPDESPKPSNDGILAVIARAASDPSVDIDKFERLLALQERVNAQQAEQEFNAAMNKAQSEIGRVVADKKNSQTSSNYASEAALDRAVRPVYARHGFSLSFNSGKSEAENFVKVICYCAHSAGHTRTYEIDMPADGKGAKGNDVMTKTHATGSGLSYGKRYLLKLIFNVAIGDDDDGNAAGGGLISGAQLTELSALAESSGADYKKLCEYFKVEALSQLPAKDYQRALIALKQKASGKKV